MNETELRAIVEQLPETKKEYKIEYMMDFGITAVVVNISKN